MNNLESVCSGIAGKLAWGLTRTFGSAIIIEFGDKITRPNSRKDHGETHLLIQGGAWRLVSKQGVVVGSDDTPKMIDSVFGTVSLGRVKSVTVDKKTLDISIFFDDKTLESFTTGVGECANDTWILYEGVSAAWAVQLGPTLTFHNE